MVYRTPKRILGSYCIHICPFQQVETQARLASIDSTSGDFSNTDISDQLFTSTVQRDAVVELSQVVCATLQNQEFRDCTIPLITEKVMELIKPKITQVVDECLQPHLLKTEHNRKTLVNQEAEINKQREEIVSLNNKLDTLEARLEEQEQYSRRTSLRF